MTDLAQEAFQLLYGEECKHDIIVKYTGRFKDYGANCSLHMGILEFGLSKKWRQISPEIQMGLMQELMLKIFKRKKGQVKTMMYVDLYNNFVKSLHMAVPKDNIDPVLKESFDRINNQYFLGLVESPNLVWGKGQGRTWGSYEFKSDTITMSKLLAEAGDELLDYVMFHEVLHKQRKFERKGSKTRYHDSKFKKLENVYKDKERLEKELNRISAKRQRKRIVRSIFRLS